MHPEESTLECVICAAIVSSTEDRVFRLEDTDCLCYRCAVQRGGVYDARTGRWTVPPNARADAAPLAQGK